MVEWLARRLREQEVRVTIISRGYGAKAGSQNDEAIELAQKLPDVPHVQNADRLAAARIAIDQHDCQLILLDDAFQHRRIGRDLDMVLIDALEPFGFDHVFPRGTLREPVDGLRRADIVAITRADMLDAEQRGAIWARVERHAPDAVRIEAAHAPRALLGCDGKQQPIDSLDGRPVAAFCGIGNPAGFRHTLATCGYDVVDFREFPDHHIYTRSDIESLIAWAEHQNVEAVLCTHKDLVKLDIEQLGGRPLWAVTIGLDILAGKDALNERLSAVVARV